MLQKCKKNFVYQVLVFLIIFTLSSLDTATAHIGHYKNLKRIEFDIYRNSKNIGKHIFSFKKSGKFLDVKSKLNFQIKKFGIVLYKYNTEGVERYEGDKLIKFSSKTNQNGKEKYVILELDIKKNKYVINGSSFKGETDPEYLVGTWWNHSLVKSKAQISAVSGRIIYQKVKFLGKETIVIDGKDYKTLHFNFSSTDKKLGKDKKLNTDIWYEEKTLNWVKASFKRKGNWTYKLVSIE